jgi:hypothetical protein
MIEIGKKITMVEIKMQLQLCLDRFRTGTLGAEGLQTAAGYWAAIGFPGPWQGGDTADRVLAVNDTVPRHKKSCGVICRSHEELATRAEQGFGLLGLGLDGSILVNSLLDSLAHVGIQRSITPTMDRQVDSASG